MDSLVKLYLERAENELALAKIIFRLTTEERIQEEIFEVSSPLTFYSAVISHAYFAIFYTAKSYLLTKGVKTKPPEEHRKVFEAFKRLVEDGVVDVELLQLYEKVMLRADTLLSILKVEKGKRGKFTYRQLPQANRNPARESLEHAGVFFKHLYNLSQKG